MPAATRCCRSSAPPDFENPQQNGETDNVYEVEVAATDAAGNTAYQTITVTVTDADEIAPVFTSGSSPTVVENTTEVLTLGADEPVTFTLTGESEVGNDNDAFEIVDVSGNPVLSFISPPDYETPQQTGETDNAYEVEVAATDAAGNTAYQTITVTVTDADEIAPVFTSGSSPTVVENTTEVLTLGADEPVTFTLTGESEVGNDNDAFEIVDVSGNPVLSFISRAGLRELRSRLARRNNAYEVEVAATDAAGNTAYQTITVTVTDADEIAPVFTSGSSPTVVENTTEVLTLERRRAGHLQR